MLRDHTSGIGFRTLPPRPRRHVYIFARRIAQIWGVTSCRHVNNGLCLNLCVHVLTHTAVSSAFQLQKFHPNLVT